MLPLEETLKNLVSVSDNIASIEFKRGSTRLADDLIERRKLVRDTDANENKLAALCMGGSLLNKISDITKNTGTDDIGRILRSANALNQICQNGELKEKIEDCASTLEERSVNLNYLRTASEKYEQEIDLLTARNTEQNMNLDNTNELEEEEQEELEILKLEKELKSKQEENSFLNRKKMDHMKMTKDIKELNLKGAYDTKSSSYKRALDNIERLEKEIDVKKRRDNDYDAILISIEESISSSTSHSQKPATTREIYTGFRARIEKLLQSRPTNDQDDNIQDLIALFKSIETELTEILDRLKEVESTEKHITTTRSIYHKFLTYIQHRIMNAIEEDQENNVNFDEYNQLFTHNKHTLIPALELSKEAPIITPILLKLYKENEVKLSTLTTFVEELAKQRDITERQAIQCIYKLVGADLVVIDRSHKDSLVKLKLVL